MKVNKDNKSRWYYDFFFGSHIYKGRKVPTRYRIITGLSKAETEKAMHEKFEQLKREKHGINENVPVQASILFEDFAKDFIELYSKAERRRPKTIQSHENSINNHLAPFFKGKTLQDITPELVDRYKAHRRENAEPATFNRERSCLRAMFRKAVRWGKIKTDPTSEWEKLTEPEHKIGVLNNDEAERLKIEARDILRPFVIIALNTGMRKTEILSLKWENINYSERFILIEWETAKSKKSRKIPMNDLVIETLSAMSRKSKYVFFNPETGKPIADVKTSFKTACKKANIKGLRIHDLRHTALSKMVEAGIDLVTISKIAGHSTIQMTMRYCHSTPELMQRAVDKLGEIYGNKPKPGNKVELKPKKTQLEINASDRLLYN